MASVPQEQPGPAMLLDAGNPAENPAGGAPGGEEPAVQTTHAKRAADDDVEFISSNPVKKRQPVQQFMPPPKVNQPPALMSAAATAHLQQRMADSAQNDRCRSMGVGMSPTVSPHDTLLDTRGSSLPVFDNFVFPPPNMNIPAPGRLPRFSEAISPKQVPHAAVPAPFGTGKPTATAPATPPPSTVRLDQISCLDFDPNVPSAPGMDFSKMFSGDVAFPNEAFINTLGSQVPGRPGLAPMSGPQNAIPFTMYSMGNLVPMPQVQHSCGTRGPNPITSAPQQMKTNQAGQLGPVGASPSHLGPTLGGRSDAEKTAATLPRGIPKSCPGPVAPVADMGPVIDKHTTHCPPMSSASNKPPCVVCTRARQEALLKQAHHAQGPPIPINTSSAMGVFNPHNHNHHNLAGTHLQHNKHSQPFSMAPPPSGHTPDGRITTAPTPASQPPQTPPMQPPPQPPSPVAQISRSTPTPDRQPRPQAVSQPQLPITPRKKHPQNLLVDVAETVEEVFPYAAVAARHLVSPAKVAEALAGVVMLPLLRVASDKRRAGRLAHDRMREFKDVKAAWAAQGGKGGGEAPRAGELVVFLPRAGSVGEGERGKGGDSAGG